MATLSSLLLLLIGFSGTVVSGRILDREGKPLARAKIVYADTNTGRTYSAKTDKKGEFAIVGVNDGYYQVTVTTAAGEQVFSGKRNVERVNDNQQYWKTSSEEQNTLNIDLSTFSASGQKIDAEGNGGSGKLSKSQLHAVRHENAKADEINRLIPELHTALDVRDWPQALTALNKLIALDPNRWQFYQNMGMVQNSLYHYQDAATAFEKAAALAQNLPPNAQDRGQAQDQLPGIFLAEGDAYSRQDKMDAAISAYQRAASASRNPSEAYFHACSAQNNHGNFDSAIEFCRKAVQADGTKWEIFQTLATVQHNSGKSADALQTELKGIAVARELLTKQPDSPRARDGLGQMLNAAGNFYVHAKKYNDAVAAFTESAAYSSYSALPWSNLCATLYDADRLPEAVAACDQAIAADPGMSDPYFVKASALMGTGHVERGIYQAPPAVRDLLNKYLGLAPAGEHAAEAHALIEKLDSPGEITSEPKK